MTMTRAYISLGSNIGDRRHYLEVALEKLANTSGIQLRKVSSIYRSEAMTIDSSVGPDFLNAVCQIETTLGAYELLRALQIIENQCGRVRHEKWAPRSIDLDILSYGTQQIPSGVLCLPHPELTRREFVLRPLAELEPQWRHPVTCQSVHSLLENLAEFPQPGKVAACCGSFS